MPTCWRAPRSTRAMNGSPAICSEKRVQRAQSTQRSRSSSTWAEMLIGLGKVRLTPSNRVSGRPLDMAWFCSGHSPPLSQTGQSSGWLMRRYSITPVCALSAPSEVTWVRTSIPSEATRVHDAWGFIRPGGPCIWVAGPGEPSGLGRPGSHTSTRHWRQAPTGVEQRVVAEPRDLDADLLGGPDHQRALGHAHAHAVDREGDEIGGRLASAVETCVMPGLPRWRRGSRRPGRRGSRPG